MIGRNASAGTLIRRAQHLPPEGASWAGWRAQHRHLMTPSSWCSRMHPAPFTMTSWNRAMQFPIAIQGEMKGDFQKQRIMGVGLCSDCGKHSPPSAIGARKDFTAICEKG